MTILWFFRNKIVTYKHDINFQIFSLLIKLSKSPRPKLVSLPHEIETKDIININDPHSVKIN